MPYDYDEELKRLRRDLDNLAARIEELEGKKASLTLTNDLCVTCEHNFWHDPECDECRKTANHKYYEPMKTRWDRIATSD